MQNLQILHTHSNLTIVIKYLSCSHCIAIHWCWSIRVSPFVLKLLWSDMIITASIENNDSKGSMEYCLYHYPTISAHALYMCNVLQMFLWPYRANYTVVEPHADNLELLYLPSTNTRVLICIKTHSSVNDNAVTAVQSQYCWLTPAADELSQCHHYSDWSNPPSIWLLIIE